MFMGTPDFAVSSLKRLVEDGHTICGVFTQPDKPKNRGMKLTFSAVKEYALTQDLEVYQPLSMKTEDSLALLQGLKPDLTVVAAYGQILPQAVLDVAPLGSINVHSSLLPTYRGAAPINWAILDGLTTTGVTIMHMAKALDAGDIISTVETAIDPQETAPELTMRLAELGAALLSETVVAMGNGTAMRTPQDHEAHTYAPMLSRELSPLDFTKDSLTLHNQVRGLIPWPCAVAELQERTLKVFKTHVGEATTASAGTIVSADKFGIGVACSDGKILVITEIQAQGSKRMAAADYLRGKPMQV
ncbi:methionyl-tRNA formyltransferase [Bengtsoniella intestinalis]|uniref:methionyl-tRNA formyltransferase n=1 Tax=Bengtsoniella intestinalis TaxID=3073143 RepID=UPI00391F4ADD